jgi:hypothetical protein
MLGTPLRGFFLVGTTRDLVSHPRSLPVDNVKRSVGFFTDVDSAAVLGCRNPMGRFDPLDLCHHLIRGGIDDGEVMPDAVRLDDPQLRLLRGPPRKKTPCTEGSQPKL